ncbi:DNA cross-link repair protein SNM1 [Iris pallida]|uniref:DNA cross-link repair protein SNM1 n=1 Tax=Iris pallida TaxID=29817 RepID=A0AAX6ESC6_IRIPA|nr:DNA cross-link repair protein SNM1 [Iris pallida]
MLGLGLLSHDPLPKSNELYFDPDAGYEQNVYSLGNCYRFGLLLLSANNELRQHEHLIRNSI